MKLYTCITIGNYSHYVKCEKYLDILNHLGITNKWDGQMDGRTRSSNSALYHSSAC